MVAEIMPVPVPGKVWRVLEGLFESTRNYSFQQVKALTNEYVTLHRTEPYHESLAQLTEARLLVREALSHK